jgi:hypothetical protein
MVKTIIAKPAPVKISQPWLSSAVFDLTFIIGPAFISSLIVLAFKSQFQASAELPLWAWVSFILLVDVSHVYATLFRTYFKESAFKRHSTLLTAIPLLCFVGGSILYSINALFFWRALAYLAVFHFIRQQYGFIMLYSRNDYSYQEKNKFAWLDKLAVYSATIYPLLFWHSHLPRNFNWFIEGDFIQFLPEASLSFAFCTYIAIACLYLSKELYFFLREKQFNLPKNLILLGTGLSWWVGIISVNSDLAFTMTNVLSHGIPYMALVWLYERKKQTKTQSQGYTSVSRLPQFSDILVRFAPAFIAFLILLAYLEEGLWDGLIWHEHQSIFGLFSGLPAIIEPAILAILVPLLSLPQSSHYVLDGFIWRIKDKNSDWSANSDRS